MSKFLAYKRLVHWETAIINGEDYPYAVQYKIENKFSPIHEVDKIKESCYHFAWMYIPHYDPRTFTPYWIVTVAFTSDEDRTQFILSSDDPVHICTSWPKNKEFEIRKFV